MARAVIGKKFIMKHTREQVCAAVKSHVLLLSPDAILPVHTGISDIEDGLVWYEFIDAGLPFWATLDPKGSLWLSEDEDA